MYVLTKGKTQKFWQPMLKGKRLVIVSGKVGSAGKREETIFKTSNEAKAAFTEGTEQKLREGYVAELDVMARLRKRSAPESGPVARYEVSFSEKPATPASPVTRWGGSPNARKGFRSWPECSDCSKPMYFVLQVSSDQVDLKGNRSLQWFSCLDSECSFKNVVFLSKSPLETTVVKAPRKRTLAAASMILEKSFDPPLEQFESSAKAINSKAFGAAFCDKFYGYPATGNRIERIPECSKCGEEMVFLAQFLSGDLLGVEEFFVSVLLICAKGHHATYEAVRG